MSFESLPKNEKTGVLKDPEIIHILNAVNFNTLRTIFNEHAIKSGVNSDNVTLVEREHIKKGGNFSDHMGIYRFETNDIHLNEGAINLFSTQDTAPDKVAFVLSTLFHEETHALVGFKRTEQEEDALFGLLRKRTVFVKSGFQEAQKSYFIGNLGESTVKMCWFNEGMVDEMASDIFTEYLKRDPMKTLNPKKEMGFVEHYPLACLFVRCFREQIAEVSGVPEEIVWNAMIHHYINNDSLFKDEIKEALEEVFSDQFINNLASVETSFNNPVYTARAFKEVLTKERARRLFSSFTDTLVQNVNKRVGK